MRQPEQLVTGIAIVLPNARHSMLNGKIRAIWLKALFSYRSKASIFCAIRMRRMFKATEITHLGATILIIRREDCIGAFSSFY